MKEEKMKVLRMLEERKINSKEALELLKVIEEPVPGRGPVGYYTGDLRIFVSDLSNGEIKRFLFPVDEIITSALINKINLELRHFGISASLDEVRGIRDKIVNDGRFVLNKNYKKVEIWIE